MIHLENQSPKIIHGWCLIIKTYSFPEQQDDKIHLRFFFFFLKGEAEWEAAKPVPDCIAGQQQHTKEICGHKPPRTSSDHWLFPFHISAGDLIRSDLHWREHPIPQILDTKSPGGKSEPYKVSWEKATCSSGRKQIIFFQALPSSWGLWYVAGNVHKVAEEA